MKKKLAVLAAAAFTAGILLSGCGGSKGGGHEKQLCRLETGKRRKDYRRL